MKQCARELVYCIIITWLMHAAASLYIEDLIIGVFFSLLEYIGRSLAPQSPYAFFKKIVGEFSLLTVASLICALHRQTTTKYPSLQMVQLFDMLPPECLPDPITV